MTQFIRSAAAAATKTEGRPRVALHVHVAHAHRPSARQTSAPSGCHTCATPRWRSDFQCPVTADPQTSQACALPDQHFAGQHNSFTAPFLGPSNNNSSR